MDSTIYDKKLQRLHRIRLSCGPLGVTRGDLLLTKDRNKSLQGDNICCQHIIPSFNCFLSNQINKK